jgi:hypothetical protein
MVGSHLSLFVIEETPLPIRSKIKKEILNLLGLMTYRLNLPLFSQAPVWIKIWKGISGPKPNIKSIWALTISERIRIRSILDSSFAELYGLQYEDLEWILMDDKYNPKGFWRVDKEKPVELRQTTLTLQAFKRLKEVGLDEFIKEDWQLPVNVQQALGPRFYDWQLQGTPEESWVECEYHAKQILGEEGFKKFIEDLENPKKAEEMVVKEPGVDFNSAKKNDNSQIKLF